MDFRRIFLLYIGNVIEGGSKSSTHYLSDANRFDVSSKGPSSGISCNVIEASGISSNIIEALTITKLDFIKIINNIFFSLIVLFYKKHMTKFIQQRFPWIYLEYSKQFGIKIYVVF